MKSRLQEIKERLTQVDYRSHVEVLFANDLKYLVTLAESFDQKFEEAEKQWNEDRSTLVEALGALAHVIEKADKENADLKAQLIAEKLNHGTEESGTPETPQPITEGPTAGSEEQPQVESGTGNNLEPTDGSQESNGQPSGDDSQNLPSNTDGGI